MSNQYFKTNYQCLSDCRQEGCPGHEMILHVAHTSSTMSIERDGESLLCLDDNGWDALIRLSDQNPEDAFWPSESGRQNVMKRTMQDAVKDLK